MSRRPSQIRPGVVARVLAQPTLSHVALEVELLLAEVRELDDEDGPGLLQQDINQLHTLVANCLLFLDPTGRGR